MTRRRGPRRAPAPPPGAKLAAFFDAEGVRLSARGEDGRVILTADGDAPMVRVSFALDVHSAWELREELDAALHAADRKAVAS